MKILYNILLCLMILFFSACSSSASPKVKKTSNKVSNSNDIKLFVEDTFCILERGKTAITGAVIDTTIQPIEDAIISVDGDSTRTNEEGKFCLQSNEFKENTTYIINIEADGFYGDSWSLPLLKDSLNDLGAKQLIQTIKIDVDPDSLHFPPPPDGGTPKPN